MPASLPPLATLDPQKLKQLYNDSRSIYTLCLLWGLAAFIFLMAAGLGMASGRDPLMDRLLVGSFLLALATLYIVTIVGCSLRVVWGRWCAFVLCILMLFGFPLGTIIGIMGLLALKRSPELFGENRYSRQQLADEYKRQKSLRA